MQLKSREMEQTMNLKYKIAKLCSNTQFHIVKRIIISALFVISYDIYFFEAEKTLGYESIFNVVLFLFAYMIQINAENVEKRTKQYALIFAVFFSFALATGKVLYDTNSINVIWSSFNSLLIFIVSFIGYTAIFKAGCSIILNWLLTYCSQQNIGDKTWKIFKLPFLTIWILIFATWIPVFLAFYPGICSYDSFSQTNQVMQGIAYYSKYHPPLHTMIWASCFRIGEYMHLHPLCVYSLLQMFLLSMALSKMITALIQHELNNLCILFGLLFVSVNPIMSIFSLEMTKDAFFAIFFIHIALYLLELVEDSTRFFENRLNWLKFSLTLLIACLLRNNMIYVCFLCFPIAVILMKKYWKQIIALFIIPIFFYFFINGYVYAQMGIAEGNAREGLNVPIQQIAYTVKANEQKISTKEQERINEYIPYDVILDQYNPRFADPVKFSFLTENYNKDKTGFWRLWGDLFKKYPIEYINAFMTLNLPYWYPDACPVDAYSRRQYVEVLMDSGYYYSISTDSKLPWLYSFYKDFANYEAIRALPLISKLYSLATPIWLLLFCVVFLVVKREKEKILILLPSIFLWLTYMAGPVSNFRYIFPIFALYPLILGLMLKRKYNCT